MTRFLVYPTTCFNCARNINARSFFVCLRVVYNYYSQWKFLATPSSQPPEIFVSLDQLRTETWFVEIPMGFVCRKSGNFDRQQIGMCRIRSEIYATTAFLRIDDRRILENVVRLSINGHRGISESAISLLKVVFGLNRERQRHREKESEKKRDRD